MELPRQSRFGGAMEETAVVMDSAMLKFSWARPAGPEMTGRTAEAGKPDVHPFDQVILIISGSVEVTLGEGEDAETYPLGPGHLIYIPADVPHVGRALGGEPAFALEVFAPVRHDYLDMVSEGLPQK